ncbi:MAG: universal stress protein, partial [Alphaproteobacteria bacterium]
ETTWKTALAKAIDVAAGGSLHLVTVVPDFGLSMVGQFFKEGDAQRMLDEAHQQLHAFAQQHVPDDLRGNCLIGRGSIHAEILRLAQETGADLVVMASHKPGFRDYLLGPNAAHVMRHAPMSVLVVRD